MAQEFIPDEPVRSALQAKSIFSQVNVSASTNPFETAASLNPFNWIEMNSFEKLYFTIVF